MAYSEDLPGLVVHGRSDEEIESKLEGAIQDVLEASGYTVESIRLMRENEVPHFGPPAFIANAALVASAHQ